MPVGDLETDPSAGRAVITDQKLGEDDLNTEIRPQRLSEFIGQAKARENLDIFIESARDRGEPLDHVLFAGPPGLGKTTLSHIISRELGVNFKATAAPMITRPGELAAILTNLDDRDVLFIDEIHRLNPAIEEILYSAMEDFVLDLLIGEGPTARPVRIPLAKFTLVGATTRAGMLAQPLRERFGIQVKLEFYNEAELQHIVRRAARVFGYEIDDGGATEIAKRSRGTPRIAGRLVRRVRDFAHVAKSPIITQELADMALRRLEIDSRGLNAADNRYLRTIANNYNGGPVGVETMSTALAESRDTLEDEIEPFLIQQGFLQRTPRGRTLTAMGYVHLGLTPPSTAAGQMQMAI